MFQLYRPTDLWRKSLSCRFSRGRGIPSPFVPASPLLRAPNTCLPVRRRGSYLKVYSTIYNHLDDTSTRSWPLLLVLISRHSIYLLGTFLSAPLTGSGCASLSGPRHRGPTSSYLNSSYNTSSGGVNLYSGYISRVAAFGNCLFFASFVWLRDYQALAVVGDIYTMR
ncbi:hypothetical protein BDV11DRAFT_110320 [Aspergillus similis]